MTFCMPPHDAAGRLNNPTLAELVRRDAVERIKCRWCGTWGNRLSSGALVCAACDGLA